MENNWLISLLSTLFSILGKPVTTTTTSTVTSAVDSTTSTTTRLQGTKMKIALCIGVNKYPNPANNLQGCVNDANDFYNLLKSQYGFNEIKMLLDSDATLKNVTDAILNALAQKPDVFVMTNSSHGTRLVDTSGTEADGYAEAICLYDKFLMDYDFRKILAQADPKTRVVILSDSCHSAGVTREFLMAMNDFSYVSKPKYLPPPDNMEAIQVSMLPISKAIFEPNPNMKEVLLAGCKSDQYSYDASFDGRPNGAFTYYTMQLLKQNPSITYEGFITDMSKFLPSNRYPQCPVCETNEAMKNTPIFS